MVKHARRKSVTRSRMARNGRSFTAETRAHFTDLTDSEDVAQTISKMAGVAQVIVTAPLTYERRFVSVDSSAWGALADAVRDGASAGDGLRALLALHADDAPLPLLTVHAHGMPLDMKTSATFMHFDECVPWLRLVLVPNGSVSTEASLVSIAQQERALNLYRSWVASAVEQRPELGGVEREQTWPVMSIGQRVVFASEKMPWRVRAVSGKGRWLILTRRDRYTIADLHLGVRGPDNHYGIGYTTDDQCWFAADALEAGRLSDDGSEFHVSERHWRWLEYADEQPDADVQLALPFLRAATIMSNPHRYNSGHNGTRSDWQRMDRGGNPLSDLL